MNIEEAVHYIYRLKITIMMHGYPFKYSEFCEKHSPVATIFKKNVMHILFPVLQVKGTENVILYMNQHGNFITPKGKEGLPLYRYFGYLKSI
jgi:nucleoside recognition membrane protein YjiH